jgi:hypothetical protein
MLLSTSPRQKLCDGHSRFIAPGGPRGTESGNDDPYAIMPAHVRILEKQRKRFKPLRRRRRSETLSHDEK